jgi:hypothetical protein
MLILVAGAGMGGLRAVPSAAEQPPEEGGLVKQMKDLQKSLDDMSRKVTALETKVTVLETGTTALGARINTDVASVSAKIAALERHFSGSQDHAFISAGLKNEGGKSFSLILTPDGVLVLRRNNLADGRGWDINKPIARTE